MIFSFLTLWGLLADRYGLPIKGYKQTVTVCQLETIGRPFTKYVKVLPISSCWQTPDAPAALFKRWRQRASARTYFVNGLPINTSFLIYHMKYQSFHNCVCLLKEATMLTRIEKLLNALLNMYSFKIAEAFINPFQRPSYEMI